MPLGSRIVYPVRPRPRKQFPRAARWLLSAFALLALAAAGFWYALNLQQLAIDRIEVTGMTMLPVPEIERVTRDAIAGVAWRIAPRSNFFLVSSEALERELRRRFSIIERADISKRFPDRLIVRIEERKLWGIYCARGASDAPERCSYLDTRGVAYEELAHVEGSLLPVIYGSRPVLPGEPAVEPTVLDFYRQAGGALSGLQASILSLTFSTSTPEDVRLRLAEGWELWVTHTRPVGEWQSVLATVLGEDIGEKRSRLAYIDLRFGNKVFYKSR